MNINITYITTWTKDSVFLYPLVLSLFSALIFWLVFSFVPNRRRHSKIRPLVELDIINVRSELFALFDCIMREKNFSPSNFQSEIRSGLLSAEEVELGLQNKSLNEHYLYDQEISTQMLVVGRDIFKRSETIDRLIDKALNLSQFVNADEIILLERIRENVRRYDFGEKAVEKRPGTKIGGSQYLPVIPNISYRKNNFSELYSLYLELQRLIIKHFRYMDRNTAIHNVQYLFGAGKYNECIAYARGCIKFAPNDKMLIWNYIANCLYKIGAKKSAYRELYYIYKDRPYNGSLVSSRSVLENFVNDTKAVEVLLRTHSEDEFEQLKTVLQQERLQRECFLKKNRLLFEYFEKRKAKVGNSS